VKILHWWVAAAAMVATVLVTACSAGSPGPTSTPRPSSRDSTASSAPIPVASPPPAATLDKQVNSALADARSVHILFPNEPGTGGYGVDISMNRANDFYGEVLHKGQFILVLVTNGHAYLKLTAGAVKVMGFPSSVCALMCGKILELTAGDAKSMISGAQWSSLVPTPGGTSPHLHYVRTTTVDGQPAWEMSASGEGTIYLAAHGPPYPLRLVQGADRVDYTQWNSATIPPPPPASKVVNESQLQHL
jgi:hypothetical protein